MCPAKSEFTPVSLKVAWSGKSLILPPFLMVITHNANPTRRVTSCHELGLIGTPIVSYWLQALSSDCQAISAVNRSGTTCHLSPHLRDRSLTMGRGAREWEEGGGKFYPHPYHGGHF